MPKPIIARKEDLKPITGIGPGTCARLERQGKFPKRRALSDGSVGWLVSELEAWAAALPLARFGMRGEKSRKRVSA